jgi:archaellum component FlaC
MHNNQLANSAVEKLNNILKKHESDRNTMVASMKKIYSSYNALKDAFSKLTIEHTQAKKDLDRAQNEIRRLEKANGELSNDVMMLSSAVSLLDQTVGQGDDILIDSIRTVVRDFKLDDTPMTSAASATIELAPASQEKAPALALASVAATAYAEPAVASAFEMPELVSDEEAAAAECDDLLTGDDISKIEHLLSESVSFELNGTAN